MTEMWAAEQKRICSALAGDCSHAGVVEVRSMKEMGLGGLI